MDQAGLVVQCLDHGSTEHLDLPLLGQSPQQDVDRLGSGREHQATEPEVSVDPAHLEIAQCLSAR